MTTEQTVSPDPELERIAWDLEPLVDGRGRDGADALLDEADALAGRFAEQHAGKVAELDSRGLADAMRALERIHDLAGRAASFASLSYATNTLDPERGALLQRVQERSTAIETRILFFELEWAALPDERAAELLRDDALAFCRHHLETARRYRPHLLTEPEERIMTEKSVTGRGAWVRLFSELTSAIEVDLDGERQQLEVALSRLYSPDRPVRAAAAAAITEALANGLRTRAYVFNTLLHDKAVDDRLRSYPNWLASRNLANEATDESVAALIEAVRVRYDIPRRWYTLKARLLGLDRLADYDRMAAVAEEDETVPWSRAREIVLESYESFSPELARLARRFFDEHWIDAPVRRGKRGGAFMSATVPSVHPYVMLNYTAKRGDVLTVAHELGHGVHASLAQPQGIFHQSTPLTMAETASVFGETIVFNRLLELADSAESRLALLAESIEGSIATVFRQTAMNQFEDRAHTARRQSGELPVERICELWAETQHELLGDSVEITDGYRSWWSYVPHFIGVPGYVYAYAYGQLLALSVYRRYTEAGADFVPAYLDLLAAGGSRSPEELGRIVGIDLTDPAFWTNGLELVERNLVAAEEAARATGRVD